MNGAILASLLQTDLDPFRFVGDLLNSPFLKLGLVVVISFFVVLWLSLAYWTFTDAGRRGAARFFWGFVALLFPFVGALIYVIVRPPEYLLDSRERELELAVLEKELITRTARCPSCRSLVEKEYLLCPECGWNLKKPCRSCRKPLSFDWGVCPYCATLQREKNINW